jgi:hypothetical protein
MHHLVIRKTKCKEPLIDYDKSLIVTSNEYASILHQKVMDKEVVKEIREQKWKEREDKMAKCVIDSLTLNEKETP